MAMSLECRIGNGSPGHSEGHISQQISGPPQYLTTNWQAAEKSVTLLKNLNPTLVLPSHGEPMAGEDLTNHLDILVNQFDQIAKPEQSRFVDS